MAGWYKVHWPVFSRLGVPVALFQKAIEGYLTADLDQASGAAAGARLILLHLFAATQNIV